MPQLLGYEFALTAKIRKLPSWAPMCGIAIFGAVWVKDLNDWMTIQHEICHLRQQREHPIWFWVSYVLLLPLFWNPFRTSWEAEAYGQVDARLGKVPVEILAKQLAGPLYGWCCTKKQAEQKITKAMNG